FHCVQAAHPQLELALRRIFIDYRGGGFCVFQSYKSVEKNLGMGTEEIGILILYQHPQSAHKESLAPIFVASEQGLDTSVYKRVFKP
ncbi:hypothetical protein, partial [Anaerobutyricum hallii]|uniref:hypothetical protein n=2 Tax=Anaerobutyricum hallii TaxID=39488 RepID=UPI003AB20E58